MTHMLSNSCKNKSQCKRSWDYGINTILGIAKSNLSICTMSQRLYCCILHQNIAKQLLTEEKIWHKKSRELQIKDKDSNSRFYQLSIIIRQRQNNIIEVLEENGSTIRGIPNLENYFVSSLPKLFKSLGSKCFEGMEDLAVPCIIEKENLVLVLMPSKKEIEPILSSLLSS